MHTFVSCSCDGSSPDNLTPGAPTKLCGSPSCRTMSTSERGQKQMCGKKRGTEAGEGRRG